MYLSRKEKVMSQKVNEGTCGFGWTPARYNSLVNQRCEPRASVFLGGRKEAVSAMGAALKGSC